MNKQYLRAVIAVIIVFCVHIGQSQVLYFNGLGRAIVTNDQLVSDALEGDMVTPRRGTGGYTLFDLGVNVQPAEYLRAHATFRIRNEFGGFYGDGAEVNFRQLKLDGIIAKRVKYQVGDIDLAMTPYTLFNFYPNYFEHEAEIFALRRNIVYYENFFFGNKWRMQGGEAQTTLKFDKYLNKLTFRAFATRLRSADYFAQTVPDRYQFGGSFDIVQSKFFQLGFNYISFSDMEGTVVGDRDAIENKVGTTEAKFNVDAGDIRFSLFGEGGFSNYYNTRVINDTSSLKVTRDDYFYDAGISATYRPLDIKFIASYRDVGPNFSSPGAQTRRIFDLGIPSLFPGFINANRLRTPTLLDRYSDEGSRVNQTIRNTTIDELLIPFDPKYDNITPYGVATPNRRGFTVGVTAGEIDKVVKAEVFADMLNEIVSQGSVTDGAFNKRKFFGLRGGATLNLHKVLKQEKLVILNVGVNNQMTERGGANEIKLNTKQLDAGFVVEVFKGFDILGGYKTLIAEGNEIYEQRDIFNRIDTRLRVVAFQYNSAETAIAGGVRYRFSKNTFFTAQYHWMNFENKAPLSIYPPSYQIRQVFLNYTMVF